MFQKIIDPHFKNTWLRKNGEILTRENKKKNEIKINTLKNL